MPGITIGRYNPPHRSHFDFFDEILNQEEELHIGLLDTEKSYKNPLAYEERKEIIESTYSEASVAPISCKDFHPSDASPHVKYLFNFPLFKEEIEEKFPSDGTIYTGDFWEYFTYRTLGFDALKRDKRGEISGQGVRESLYNGDDRWRKFVPKKSEEILEDIFPERYEDIKRDTVSSVQERASSTFLNSTEFLPFL